LKTEKRGEDGGVLKRWIDVPRGCVEYLNGGRKKVWKFYPLVKAVFGMGLRTREEGDSRGKKKFPSQKRKRG